jgi:hypothetical protein
MAKTSLVGLVIGSTFVASFVCAQGTGHVAPFAFGAPGQIAISSDFSAQIGSHAEIAADGNTPASTTTVSLSPALDVFVAPNFSVGGQVALQWSTTGGSTTSGFGVGPRVGYDLPMSDTISFWPKGGLSFAFERREVSRSRVTAEVYAPFLLHPAPHFFVGLGPLLAVDLVSRWDGNAANRNLDFALSTTVGGWF